MNKKLSLIYASTVVACMSSCVETSKDLFDFEKTKDIYEQTFPIKDIDPSMTWKTTNLINASVGINEDEGVDYKIGIYDADPLFNAKEAHLLAEGIANNSLQFTTSIDVPNALKEVYILRTDAKNRHILKCVSIENGTIHTSFNIAQATTRSNAIARAEGIYTPEQSEQEIKALLSNAIELTPSTLIENGGVYKISKGNTFDGIPANHGCSQRATIIVEGNWSVANTNKEHKFNTGIDIYMLSGANFDISNKTVFVVGSTRFVIYPNGSITGSSNSVLNFTNASKGNVNYNGGEIKIKTLQSSEPNGYFYNAGTVEVEKLSIDNNGIFANYGHLTAKETHANTILENGCKAQIENFTGIGLTTHENSYIGITHLKQNWNRKITLGANSMVYIQGDTQMGGNTITGPSNGYALVKVDKIDNVQNSRLSGNVYYEIQNSGNLTNAQDWLKPFIEALKNSNGTFSRYGESPLYLPAGHCTGEGNTPNEWGEDITDLNPMKYTYAFEDNFPQPGDYDFNDIIMNVSTDYTKGEKNKIEKIHYQVSINAVGAIKKLGAGLRLVGISKSQIESITFGGDASIRETLHNSVFENATTEAGDNNVVIPLFGDAHAIYGYGANRTFLNTKTERVNHIKTLEIIITLADKSQTKPAITKENLDFFIAYKHGNSARTEVHLYEFLNYGATARGTIHDENIAAAGNRTWAICIPEFKYPSEFSSIKDAYPVFEQWAQNHTSHLDWYRFPSDDKDKIYSHQ